MSILMVTLSLFLAAVLGFKFDTLRMQKLETLKFPTQRLSDQGLIILDSKGKAVGSFLNDCDSEKKPSPKQNQKPTNHMSHDHISTSIGSQVFFKLIIIFGPQTLGALIPPKPLPRPSRASRAAARWPAPAARRPCCRPSGPGRRRPATGGRPPARWLGSCGPFRWWLVLMVVEMVG